MKGCNKSIEIFASLRPKILASNTHASSLEFMTSELNMCVCVYVLAMN